MSLLDDIFGWLGDLLTSLWQLIQKALPYVMLALALVCLFMTGPLSLSFLGMSFAIPAGWLSACVVMGASFLLAPEETAGLVTPAVHAVGSAVTAVAEEAGQAIGAGASSLAQASGFSSLLLIGGLAALAFFLLSDREDEGTSDPSTPGGSSTGRNTTIDYTGQEVRGVTYS